MCEPESKPHNISHEEQRTNYGIVRREKFVVGEVSHQAQPVPPIVGEIVGYTRQMAGEIMGHETHTSHIRQVDNATSHAEAALLYSRAYAVAAATITAALTTIVWIFRGGNLGVYFFAGMLVWGLAVLVILYLNRAQGLRHSSTAIAKHEIDARVEVAKYTIDRTHETFEKVLSRVYGERGKDAHD